MNPRRGPFVAVLVLLVVVAVAVVAWGSGDGAIPAAPSAQGASQIDADASGRAWFCPGFPEAIPAADTQVTFANTGATPADVVVTLVPDAGAAGAAPTTFTLAPRAVETRPRAVLGAAGALTIETFGGTVVVEEGTAGASGADSRPCATESSSSWYFAAGATTKGIDQWLIIDNPFASDAKVDIVLRTGSGVRKADALQGFDVPQRSRAVVPVHETAVREERVAVEVSARVGRVVAAQVSRFGSDAGVTGVMSVLGATAPSDDWWFAAGANGAPTGYVAIVNVGTTDTQVEVQTFVEDGPDQEPTTVDLPRDDVVWVQLGGCNADTPACLAVVERSRYGLRVRSDAGGAVVADVYTASPDSSAPGVAVLNGVNAPRAGWQFARSRVDDERVTTVTVWNPGEEPTRVDIVLVVGGKEERPPELQGVEASPGRPVTLQVAERGAGSDGAIVIRAGAPVVVERTLATTKDFGRTAGVAVG